MLTSQMQEQHPYFHEQIQKRLKHEQRVRDTAFNLPQNIIEQVHKETKDMQIATPTIQFMPKLIAAAVSALDIPFQKRNIAKNFFFGKFAVSRAGLNERTTTFGITTNALEHNLKRPATLGWAITRSVRYDIAELLHRNRYTVSLDQTVDGHMWDETPMPLRRSRADTNTSSTTTEAKTDQIALTPTQSKSIQLHHKLRMAARDNTRANLIGMDGSYDHLIRVPASDNRALPIFIGGQVANLVQSIMRNSTQCTLAAINNNDNCTLKENSFKATTHIAMKDRHPSDESARKRIMNT